MLCTAWSHRVGRLNSGSSLGDTVERRLRRCSKHGFAAFQGTCRRSIRKNGPEGQMTWGMYGYVACVDMFIVVYMFIHFMLRLKNCYIGGCGTKLEIKQHLLVCQLSNMGLVQGPSCGWNMLFCISCANERGQRRNLIYYHCGRVAALRFFKDCRRERGLGWGWYWGIVIKVNCVLLHLHENDRAASWQKCRLSFWKLLFLGSRQWNGRCTC